MKQSLLLCSLRLESQYLGPHSTNQLKIVGHFHSSIETLNMILLSFIVCTITLEKFTRSLTHSEPVFKYRCIFEEHIQYIVLAKSERHSLFSWEEATQGVDLIRESHIMSHMLLQQTKTILRSITAE